MSEEEESQYISEATATLQQHCGNAPGGWLGPWISQSHITPDLLQVQQCHTLGCTPHVCMGTQHKRIAGEGQIGNKVHLQQLGL